MDVFKTKVTKEHYRVKFDINNLTARGQGEPSWVCKISFEHLNPESVRFPRAFLEAIVTWFGKLSWGFDFDDHYNCITWVELYIDFTLSTGCLAPGGAFTFGPLHQLLSFFSGKISCDSRNLHHVLVCRLY